MIKVQEWELAQERRTEETAERKLEERLEAVLGDSENERTENAARYAQAAVKMAQTENALKQAADRAQ